MGKKKKLKNYTNNNVEIWTEGQYEEYLQGLHGMESIAGFTEGGVPFGIFEEEEEMNASVRMDISCGSDDEIPF